MEAPNRFGVVSDEELLRIISEGTNGNTARATSTWLRVVSEYREEKGVGLSFATCTAEELAAFLERFYAEVKPKKHGEYSKSSYLAALAAIQRHLRIVKRPFNIFSDEPFAQANKVLDCVLKRHKKMGLERQTKHKDPISGEDLAKVSAYFDDVLENPTPTKVTEYCWFVITCHFCLRAREVQASIRKDDLIFEAGGDGQMSVRLGADFKEEVKSPAPFSAGSTSVPCDKHQEVEEEKEAEEAKEKQQPASEGSAQFPGCVKICGNSNTTIHFNVDWSCVSAPPPKRPRKGQ